MNFRHVHNFSAHAGAMHRKTVHTAVRTVFRDMSRWRREIRDIGASWLNRGVGGCDRTFWCEMCGELVRLWQVPDVRRLSHGLSGYGVA